MAPDIEEKRVPGFLFDPADSGVRATRLLPCRTWIGIRGGRKVIVRRNAASVQTSSLAASDHLNWKRPELSLLGSENGRTALSDRPDKKKQRIVLSVISEGA